MSGVICIIIASGNRSQAYAEAFADASATGIMPNARIAAHQALTLCQLGTTTYDGKEVMTDDQQKRATVIMGDFNEAARGIDVSKPFSGREFAHADMTLAIFNRAAQFLIDEILSNP